MKRNVPLPAATILLTLLILGALSPPRAYAEEVTVRVFHSRDCPYCVEAIAFLRELQAACPEIDIVTHEVYQEKEFWQQFTREHDLPAGLYPLTVIGEVGFIGFLEGEGPLERDPTGKAYLGYSSQIVQAIRQAGATCDLTAFDGRRSEDAVADAGPPEDASGSRADSSRADSSGGADTPDGPAGSAADPSPLRAAWMLLAIPLYAASYIPLRKKLGEDRRRTWWITGLLVLTLVTVGGIIWSLPEAALGRIANSMPFPGFVAVVALADGFNPCAFTVLIILLSLLTHLKRREAMALIAGTFVVTSAVMYGIFILAFALVGGWFLSSYGPIVLRILGALVVLAGAINVLDGLGVRLPTSLSLSADQKASLSRRAGRIVSRLQKPGGATLLAGLGGTVLLASAANLAELGCTAILPLVFIARLFGNYGTAIRAPHLVWTAVYAGIYVIPLATVAGGSVLLLRRGRMSEAGGNALKTAGGLFMLAFGLGMLLRPEWLGV